MEELDRKEDRIDIIVEERKLNRITIDYIFRSFLDAFNIERGAVYTLKRLFSNPGQMAKDYLGKERFRFVPPFRLLIISTAIVIYILSELGFGEEFLSNIQEGAQNSVKEKGGNIENDEATKGILEILKGWGSYFNLILWTLIPILALFTYLFNRKLKFNYAEHLVLQTYFFCLTNILTYLVLFQFIIDQIIITNVLGLFSIVYFIYFYKVAFSKGLGRSIVDCIFIYFFSSLLWMLVLTVLFLIQVTIAV